MAITISNARPGGIVYSPNDNPQFWRVNILCDTEDDIKAFDSGKGHVISEGDDPEDIRVKPLPESVAYTADASVGYKLRPSYVWTKFKG